MADSPLQAPAPPAAPPLAFDPSTLFPPEFTELLDPAVRADPYPMYARLREASPLGGGPLGIVLFARHAPCQGILTDPRSGADRTKGNVFQLLRGAGRPYPLPVMGISELLGVPPEDHERFRGWSAVLARSLDPDFGVLNTSPEARDRRRSSMFEFGDYFREQIARRRAEPRDDLLSRLVQAEEAGDQLTEDELLSTCVLLLVAGHETTVNLIANGSLALVRHPDQLALLRDGGDAALARSAVEEVLRFDPPVHFTSRIPLEPMEVGGTVVPQGGIAVLLLAAANRDPDAFPEPDRFDITRSPNDHLAFGMGAHFCLGAPLARLEGQIALSALARRLVEPSLLQDPLEYKANFTLRGLASLPVAFESVRPA